MDINEEIKKIYFAPIKGYWHPGPMITHSQANYIRELARKESSELYNTVNAELDSGYWNVYHAPILAPLCVVSRETEQRCYELVRYNQRYRVT